MPTLTVSGSPTFNGDTVTIHTSADRIQCPVELLSATTGWVAMRFASSANWNDSTTTAGGNYVFEWGPTVNDRLSLYWGSTAQSGGWRMNRTGASSGTENVNFVAFSSGVTQTVIGQWTSAGVQQSFNGGTFTSLTAQTSVPNLTSQTQFDIGRESDRLASGWLDGDVYWFTAGTGTLTNANASTINGFGDTNPTWASIPGTPTILWTAVDSTYLNAAPSVSSGIPPSLIMSPYIPG
jgi:hypothetical protein